MDLIREDSELSRIPTGFIPRGIHLGNFTAMSSVKLYLAVCAGLDGASGHTPAKKQMYTPAYVGHRSQKCQH